VVKAEQANKENRRVEKPKRDEEEEDDEQSQINPFANEVEFG